MAPLLCLALGLVAEAAHAGPAPAEDGTLAGVVVDGRGRPVAGARVLIGREGIDDVGEEPRHTGQTTEDGRFALSGLPRHLLQVSVRASGFLLWEGQVQPSSEAIRVVLDPGATLAGRVVAQGEPAEHLHLRIRNRPTGQDGPFFLAEVDADAEGRFSVGGLPPGSYDLAVHGKTGATTRRGHAVAEVSDHGQALIEVTLGAGWELSGVVVDGAGRPVPGAQLEAESEAVLETIHRYRCSSVEGVGDHRAVSDPQGRFRLRYLEEGRYRVSAQARGLTRTEAVVLPGREELRLQLLSPGRVLGRVVDEAGRAVPRFHVDGRDFESADGTFVLTALQKERKSLVFSAKGLAKRVVEVQAAPGRDQRLPDVVLGRGRILEGRVVDAITGEPIPKAQVRAIRPDGLVWEGMSQRSWATELARGSTGPDGHFRLEQVSFEATRLTIAGPAQPADLAIPREPQELLVRLNPGARLSGRAVVRSGTTLMELVVLARGPAGMARTSSHGDTYAFEHLSAGTYQVRAIWRTPGGVIHSSDMVQVAVGSRGAVQQDLSEAAAGAQVMLQARDAISFGSGGAACLVPVVAPVPERPVDLARICEDALLRPIRSLLGREELGFGRVPSGVYTLYLLRRGDWESPEARLRVVQQRVEIPQSGVLRLKALVNMSVPPLPLPEQMAPSQADEDEGEDEEQGEAR